MTHLKAHIICGAVGQIANHVFDIQFLILLKNGLSHNGTDKYNGVTKHVYIYPHPSQFTANTTRRDTPLHYSGKRKNQSDISTMTNLSEIAWTCMKTMQLNRPKRLHQKFMQVSLKIKGFSLVFTCSNKLHNKLPEIW